MPTRRETLGALLMPVLPGACAPRTIGGAAQPLPAPPTGRSPADLARDEDYWAEVARAFTIDRTAINPTLEELDRFCTAVEQVIRKGTL